MSLTYPHAVPCKEVPRGDSSRVLPATGGVESGEVQGPAVERPRPRPAIASRGRLAADAIRSDQCRVADRGRGARSSVR